MIKTSCALTMNDSVDDRFSSCLSNFTREKIPLIQASQVIDLDDE